MGEEGPPLNVVFPNLSRQILLILSLTSDLTQTRAHYLAQD